ncbi:hypothetical protein BJ508DRAFT_416523, partial [Ascobolus immersus RN42]
MEQPIPVKCHAGSTDVRVVSEKPDTPSLGPADDISQLLLIPNLKDIPLSVKPGDFYYHEEIDGGWRLADWEVFSSRYLKDMTVEKQGVADRLMQDVQRFFAAQGPIERVASRILTLVFNASETIDLLDVFRAQRIHIATVLSFAATSTLTKRLRSGLVRLGQLELIRLVLDLTVRVQIALILQFAHDFRSECISHIEIGDPASGNAGLSREEVGDDQDSVEIEEDHPDYVQLS